MLKNLKSAKFSVVGITILVIFIYWGLRSLPDSECGFLHYDVTEISSNGIEFCRGNQSVFINMSELEFPVSMRMEYPEPLEVDKKVDVFLTFFINGDKILYPHDIALSHTQKIHLMLVDSSLEDYHHIHPEPIGGLGQWTFSFTPRKSGAYKAFAEMVPVRTKRHVLSRSEIIVKGVGGFLQVDSAQKKQRGGYVFEITTDAEPLLVDLNNKVKLAVTKKDGSALVLEPIMGAYAHLVAFDQERNGMCHMHPISRPGQDINEPNLEFSFFTKYPGKYKIWVQVKLDDTEYFVPFDIEALDV